MNRFSGLIVPMISEWMANGNFVEYIEHNESYRVRLVCDYSSRLRAGTDDSHVSSTVRRGYNITTI